MKSKAHTFILQNASENSLLAVCGGCLLLIALSQIIIPLPFTPVPITGQTLGVASISLGLSRNKALGAILLYLLLAWIGLPILAGGHHLSIPSPSFGYLAGMLLATFVMGTWAKSPWMNDFKKTYFVIFLGSVITFSCGLLGLAFYVPTEKLLMTGVIPFIPGDIIKSLLASFIFYPRGSK